MFLYFINPLNYGKKCCPVTKTAWLLVIIGALNWGLVGALNFDLVSYIAGMIGMPIIGKIIYIIVGLAGVMMLLKMCKKYSGGSCSK